MRKGGGTLQQPEQLRVGYGFLSPRLFLHGKITQTPVLGVEVSDLGGELLARLTIFLPSVPAELPCLGATSPRERAVGSLSTPGDFSPLT